MTTSTHANATIHRFHEALRSGLGSGSGVMAWGRVVAPAPIVHVGDFTGAHRGDHLCSLFDFRVGGVQIAVLRAAEKQKGVFMGLSVLPGSFNCTGGGFFL